MRILFATSIQYPEIGGPALYTANLPRELRKRGVESNVVCLKKIAKPLRELVFFGELFLQAPRHDILYCLSASPAVTLPTSICAFLFGKKFFLRPGGDLLWERAMEKRETEHTLQEFYRRGLHKNHRLMHRALAFSLRQADGIIFPTVFLRDLYREFYGIDGEKCHVIDYPFPDVHTFGAGAEQGREKQFLFSGRLIRFKNSERLIRAFAAIGDKRGFFLKIVGEGPQKQNLLDLVANLGAQDNIVFQNSMPHQDLLREISKSYCVVIPSIFEPGSFLALECLALKIPLIFTKEAGLYERYREDLLCVDPYSLDDIRGKIESLMEPARYEKYRTHISRIVTERGWGNVADEHVQAMRSVLRKRVLFIGGTAYNLREANPHLARKFEGLAKGFDVYSIARGKPVTKRIWNSNFYLVNTRLLFVPFAYLVGLYLCLFKRIDTIVCQTPLTESLVGIPLSKMFGKELIVEVHGDWKEMPFLSRKRLFASVLKKIVPAIGAWSLRRADKIRVLSKYFEGEVKREVPNKPYFVFPTYTDIDYFLEEKNASFQKYILTVAILSPIKSIETLIEAFSKIHSQFRDFKFIIVGDGPSKPGLQLAVDNLQLTTKVVFTGRLSQERVRDIMKDCWVFVLPSLSEGFGRVVIEAMALGKPVVATRVGGLPELVRDGENGFLVEPKDSEQLARKLTMVLQDSELAATMGARGRKFVETHFSNEKYIRNFTEMIYA